MINREKRCSECLQLQKEEMETIKTALRHRWTYLVTKLYSDELGDIEEINFDKEREQIKVLLTRFKGLQ